MCSYARCNQLVLFSKNITPLARLLGALFYYSPKSENTMPLLEALVQIDQLTLWEDSEPISKQCKILRSEIATADLTYHHSMLFEGQGELEVPPWGSFYLDNEQLLMGESSEHYRVFLKQHGIALNTGQNEPEDQFGLMLMAFALLMEKEKVDAAKQLINQHLMTWAPIYLTKLSKNTISPFYQALAVITQQYIAHYKNITFTS